MADPTAFFYACAESLLERESITRSTMMGYPCLRVDGDFFASVHPESGSLIIKLSADRVNAMVESGEGQSFAPNGRRFKEWVLIAEQDASRWNALLDEACAFVSTLS